MRSPARILFVLFTLLLTVQGEPRFGRPHEGDRPSCRRPIRARRGLRHLPPRPAVVRRRGGLRLRCTASDGRTGGGAVGGRTGGTRRSEAGRRRAAVAGSGSSASFWNFARPRRSRFRRRSVPERELILRRADAATCGAFAAADASCGCCALAETALRRPMEQGSGRGMSG